MQAAIFAVNHAKLMLSTAARVQADPDGYQEGYLEDAEGALLRAAESVGGLRNRS